MFPGTFAIPLVIARQPESVMIEYAQLLLHACSLLECWCSLTLLVSCFSMSNGAAFICILSWFSDGFCYHGLASGIWQGTRVSDLAWFLAVLTIDSHFDWYWLVEGEM